MKILLVITICSSLGCLPPMTHPDWTYENEDQCMMKGYYRIAEVAETYMKTVGVQQFKDMRVRMMYSCLTEDAWKKSTEPKGKESTIELPI
jgi:hypothetical protein|tara:strand:- start:1646 stop:1918 length:273 start_codon:yes stop_codon:yes gene_type:complete